MACAVLRQPGILFLVMHMLFLLPAMPKVLLFLDPDQCEAFPDPHTHPANQSLSGVWESEQWQKHNRRLSVHSLDTVSREDCSGRGLAPSPHGAAQPWAFLIPGLHVRFLCLLVCSPVAPTPKCWVLLQEACRTDWDDPEIILRGHSPESQPWETYGHLHIWAASS